jgi:putative transposase
MLRTHASRDVRERALAALDAGRCVADVAACVQVDASTVRRWRRRRATTGEMGPRPGSGRPRRVDPGQHDALLAQVQTTPDATLAEHCARWAATTGVQLSAATMRRSLRRLGLTLKKRP